MMISQAIDINGFIRELALCIGFKPRITRSKFSKFKRSLANQAQQAAHAIKC